MLLCRFGETSAAPYLCPVYVASDVDSWRWNHSRFLPLRRTSGGGHCLHSLVCTGQLYGYAAGPTDIIADSLGRVVHRIVDSTWDEPFAVECSEFCFEFVKYNGTLLKEDRYASAIGLRPTGIAS